MDKSIFTNLAKLFNDNGYHLFMIGGTSRDFLLDLDVLDFDFVSNATPDEMKAFVKDANFSFAKYGTIRLKVDDKKIDIATFRKESEYLDYRHPSKIEFVKTIEEDYVRRDFTINAIYIDENFKIIDPANGMKDLENKTIRFIGNPVQRIKEDPLRILRAERFAKKLGFSIEEKTLLAIEEYRYLLDELNPDKVKEEMKKMENK